MITKEQAEKLIMQWSKHSNADNCALWVECLSTIISLYDDKEPKQCTHDCCAHFGKCLEK